MHSLTKRIFITLVSAVLLSACGGDDSGDVNDDLLDARAYKSNSPYADIIDDCIRVKERSGSCTLAQLPLLGMVFDDPTIPQIMDRVVVSHSWMGERFEELLSDLPPEILPLFRGVTAVVIDDDIRPAYYTTTTGAIYLDPAFLWLSVEEKTTINTKEDYRSGFDDPLDFRHLARYLVNGASAYRNLPLTDQSTRELEDIKLMVARLLLHELAHANDFAPPDSYDSFSLNQKVSDAVESISSDWISTRLSNLIPLESETMRSLAGVMYRGNTPTNENLQITASEVGDAFEPDGAGDDYGYTSQYEDLAMLFETAMMKRWFDADYEIAFTSVPENPSFCNYYLIGWGSRNRIGHDSVRDRAAFAVDSLLPELSDSDSFFANLESPTEISGDWCLESPSNSNQKPALVAPFDTTEQLRPYL